MQASIDQVDGGGVRRMTVSADLRGELRGDRRSAEEDFDVDETGRPDSVSLSSRSGGSFCPDSRRPSMMGVLDLGRGMLGEPPAVDRLECIVGHSSP